MKRARVINAIKFCFQICILYSQRGIGKPKYASISTPHANFSHNPNNILFIIIAHLSWKDIVDQEIKVLVKK